MVHFTHCPSSIPPYYPIVLHTIAGLSVFVNFTGFYLVWHQSPKMKGYKYCLFYLQLTSFISELDMSILAPGFYFFPMIAGLNLGFNFGQNHYWMTLYFFIFAFELPSILLCLVYRHNAAEDISFRANRRYVKKLFLFLSHVFPFAVAFSFGKANLTYEQKYEHLRSKWPECLEWINNPNFEVYDYNMNPWLAVAGIGAVSAVFLVYIYGFFLAIQTMTTLQKYRKSMSPQTYQMHKTALFSLFMQIVIPGILIVVPLLTCMFVVVTEAIELQQVASNTQFLIASHSMCSSIVMIWSNPHYRKCLKEKLSAFLRLLKVIKGNGIQRTLVEPASSCVARTMQA